MAAPLKAIVALLEARYPFAWAVAGDRTGFQVGDPEALVERVLVALEVSEAVVAEAQARGAQALLTHHPLLYQPFQEVREDQPGGRLLAAVLRAGLAVVACHTNLDVAPQGLNHYLARILGLEGVEVLAETGRDPWYKLTVFVPVGYEERVRQALFDDRIGAIGRYSHCSFAGRGQGTYLPLEGARPFRGEVAALSRAAEVRLEVLVPESRVNVAVARLKAAHPYEEVAYDLYPLKNPGLPLGFGCLGYWPQPLALKEVVSRVKELFQVAHVRVWGRPPAKVTRLAVCGGSGGDLIPAARGKGAQLFLTGEVRHHQAVPGNWQDFAILEVGHFSSEAVFIPEWARQLRQLLEASNLTVEVLVSAAETAPFGYL
jgi:dinuclear metal center YbgI/SA1388 family protein